MLSDPRCGSIIVDLALKFNSTTKEQDVIVTLNDALKGGKLEEFSVGSIKGKDLMWNQQVEVPHQHLTEAVGVSPPYT